MMSVLESTNACHQAANNNVRAHSTAQESTELSETSEPQPLDDTSAFNLQLTLDVGAFTDLRSQIQRPS